MTNKVDVLAVMDAEIARYETSAEIHILTCSDSAASDLYRRVQPLREARAAVAELIKAAQRMESAVGIGARCEARAMLSSALSKVGA